MFSLAMEHLSLPQQLVAAAVFPIAIRTAYRDSEEHNLYFRT
jgi:hypothetical protein